jgi:peptidoglycan/xylan/chitin deacetylase (PgdA/CDA1 family)
MVLIPNKREFLARRMGDAGLVALLERQARRKPTLLVLTYHRIGNPAQSPYYRPIASATAETLEAELRILNHTHRVITLERALTLAENGFHVKEPTALVTFDDGYRDNAEVALPVLTSVGVPATFFLPTALIQEPRLPWWDYIAYVVGRTTVPLLRLERPEPIEIDLERTPREEAISRVVWAYFDNLGADEQESRAELAERTGVVVDESTLAQALFMTWDQARALVTAGMSVGSHAHTHRDLARLSEEELRVELSESKQILERELSREVTALAYPYGWVGTYDERTQRIARETGYRLGFSSHEGVNRPGKTNPYAIRRLGIGFADSPHLLRARWALHQVLGNSFL